MWLFCPIKLYCLVMERDLLFVKNAGKSQAVFCARHRAEALNSRNRLPATSLYPSFMARLKNTFLPATDSALAAPTFDPSICITVRSSTRLTFADSSHHCFSICTFSRRLQSRAHLWRQHPIDINDTTKQKG